MLCVSLHRKAQTFVKKLRLPTELLKGHLKNKYILNLWPQNLWERVRICDHRFESVGTDCNLWPQIRICGNEFESVANLWEQI